MPWLGSYIVRGGPPWRVRVVQTATDTGSYSEYGCRVMAGKLQDVPWRIHLKGTPAVPLTSDAGVKYSNAWFTAGVAIASISGEVHLPHTVGSLSLPSASIERV